MSVRWEYLIVTWQYTTNWVTKEPHEDQTWDSFYIVTRPGGEPERITAEDFRWSGFVNDLGGEGWEMATESLRKSIIFGQLSGWNSVGAPIEIVWHFKRPAG